MATSAAAVDDTQAFLKAMKLSYTSFDDFMQDFRAFQMETSSSFYMYNSITANQWIKKGNGKPLPPGFPYQLAKLCCVHRKRKQNQGKRFKNYNCKAFVVVKLVDLKYRLVKWSVLHSHSFHVEKPSMYSKNRRLSDEEESQLSYLMDSVKSTQGIIQYAYERFNRRLTRWDVQAMRARLSKPTETPEEAISVQDKGIISEVQVPPTTSSSGDCTDAMEEVMDTTPMPSECIAKNGVTEGLTNNFSQRQTLMPKLVEPRSSTSAQNYTTQHDSRMALIRPKNTLRRNLCRQLLKDLEFRLNNLNDLQFHKQLKALNSFNAALGCWPYLELFACVPGDDRIVGLSNTVAVTQLVDKFKRKQFKTPESIYPAAAAAAVTSTASAKCTQNVCRQQSGPTTNTRRKPLMVLRETIDDDDLRVLCNPIQQQSRF